MMGLKVVRPFLNDIITRIRIVKSQFPILINILFLVIIPPAFSQDFTRSEYKNGTQDGIWNFRTKDLYLKKQDYLNGKELCLREKGKLSKEISFWIPVVKYPAKPSLGKTFIYAFTLKPYDPYKPSLIFINGGPGASGRSMVFDLPDTNVIFLDQRGIACSRPEAYEDFMNPQFYSSLITANDILLILDYFKINKITLYGHSYGTVTATVFASLFPERVQQIILEGVIFDAGKSLIHSTRKQENLQAFFNSLSTSSQDKIILLGESILPNDWFSKVGSVLLYLNEGLIAYKRYLDNILKQSDSEIKSAISYFYNDSKSNEDLYFSSVVMGMISCQETLVAKAGLSSVLKFNRLRKLVYDKQNLIREQFCRPLQLLDPPRHPYQAAHFPLQVPVFYFLGETDGTTDLDQGVRHFIKVPQGERHLLVLQQGGHLPSVGFLKENQPCDPVKTPRYCELLKVNVIHSKLVNHIVHHGEIDKNLLKEFNNKSELQWNYIH